MDPCLFSVRASTMHSLAQYSLARSCSCSLSRMTSRVLWLAFKISSISVSLRSRSPLDSLCCLSVLLRCSSDLTDWVALIGFGLALMAFLLFSYGVLVLSCLLLLMPCDMVFSVPASAIYHLKFALLYCSYYDSHSALFVWHDRCRCHWILL